MRICFVVNEIFHWGVYGGFGSLTRTIGSELAKRGHEIYVLMPKVSTDQRTLEQLDGMTVVGMSTWKSSFYQLCDADIYHSEDPSPGSYYSQKKNKNAKHLITFQDPRTLEDDKRTIWSFNSKWRNPAYRMSMEIRLRIGKQSFYKAIHNADKLTCQAKYIIPMTISMFKLKESPSFLPNPVEIPLKTIKKSDKPTVCFMGRWDNVKRVELFFELAKEFKDVRFIAAGAAHYKPRDEQLRTEFGKIPNLEMPGLVFGKQRNDILEESWILINTSMRECLPVSFLEAAAYKCAILSNNNPDNFAQDFGYFAKEEEYSKGLRILLKDDAWKEKGVAGYEYVRRIHEMSKVIDQHVELYKKMID
jgi:glycosyltransferase involved in cell wall biosynthesis